MKREESDALFALDGLDPGCVSKSLSDFIATQAYFVSGHFGYNEKYSLEDPSYKIDLSNDSLQLYRGEHGQTFFNLKVASLAGGRRGYHKRKPEIREPFPMDGNASMLQISVDLTRFNRRILTGNRPHPLIRKTPVHEMEMFVYNRRTNFSELPSRRLAYLDILNEDTEGGFQPFCFELEGTLEDEDSILDLIPNADDLMAIGHSQLLSTDEWCPLEWVSNFMSLLRAAQLRFGLFDRIPAEFQDLVGALAKKMVMDAIPCIGDSATLLMDCIALFDELGIEVGILLDQTPQVHLVSYAEAKLSSFLKILRRWDLWLSINDPKSRDAVFSWLIAEVDQTLLDQRSAFVFRNACEQARVFLSELRDGCPDSTGRCSGDVSLLGNLRVDPAQPFWSEGETTEDPTSVEPCEGRSDLHARKSVSLVTLYRVQAIPMGVRFAIGEYVCLSRQASGGKDTSSEKEASGATRDASQTQNHWTDSQYDVDFPPLYAAPTETTIDVNEFAPKRASFCLARVVSLCEAPFSMTVKLISPSFGHEAAPELLSKCLELRKQIYWKVAIVPANVVTHMRVVDAIEAFLPSSENQKLCKMPDLFPHLFDAGHSLEDEPVSMFALPTPPTRDELDSLNDKQAEAVQSSFQCRVSLVHGPPGTGKTTTAVQIMMQILKRTDNRILVCAETNLAVDNLALRFLRENEYYGAIRVGGRNVDKRESALEEINLETCVRKEVTTKAGQSFLLSRHKKVIDAMFKRSRIVFATCAGAGDPLLDGQQFDSVLMDEASISTEPGALCPLTHGCRHFVLIGDHKQLGPHASGGVCMSLFERLALPCNPPTTMTLLNEQHRMHPELCLFPSHSFYDGQLLTAAGISAARKVPQAFFGGREPVRYLDVPNGREERIGSGSWYNEVEIQVVLQVLHELISGKESFKDGSLTAAQITVLTPYRAQQMKIRERLSGWRDAPEVNSVDGYQGRENDVIIVSTVRCAGSLGFCNDERRINVLLTRAKRGLVVIGSRSTLGSSRLWASWLKEAK